MAIHLITGNTGERIIIVTPSGEEVVVTLLGDELIGVEVPEGLAVERQDINYRVGFDSALEIVNVAYIGTVSLEERKRAVKEVCDAYSQLSPLKILVDVIGLDMNLSVTEQMEFGEYLAVHEGLRNARVGVLHKPEHNPNVLIDTCAFNNGYLLAEFNARKNAEAWLTKNDAA